MQTITIQVENDTALKALENLEEKHLITIVKNPFDSPSLPGAPMEIETFKNWVNNSEKKRHNFPASSKRYMGSQKKGTPGPYIVVVTTNASHNLDEITGYIAFINKEPANAVRVGDKILSTIDRISNNPYAFKECEELPTKDKRYRRALCLSWTIIYKIIGQQIYILGIIHQSRHPAKIKSLKGGRR